MAGTLNKVTLIGRLGQDPEVMHTRLTSTSTGKIVKFNMATTEYWTNSKTKERESDTQWHKVVVYNEKIADIVEKYLQKGDMVYVEGQLQTRKYTDKAGMERYVTEVVMKKFDSKILLLNNKEDKNTIVQSEQEKALKDIFGGNIVLNDEIPF